MTCAGCANTVKMRFEGIPSVENVEISLDEKMATIDASERISDKVLVDALDGTNYKVIQ